jgi:hypothetical protein
MSIDRRLKHTADALHRSVDDVDVVARLHELPRRQRAQSARAVALALAFLAATVIPALIRSGSPQEVAAPSSTTLDHRDVPRATSGWVSGNPAPTVEPVTVQVLNGQSEQWKQSDWRRLTVQLENSGYYVVATQEALDIYWISTVYYTKGHQADAEAFRAHFPIFRDIEPAPANLSSRIDLHVVLGSDFRPPLAIAVAAFSNPLALGCGPRLEPRVF